MKRQLVWIGLAWGVWVLMSLTIRHAAGTDASSCHGAFAAGLLAHFVWDSALLLAAMLTGWTIKGACNHKPHGSH